MSKADQDNLITSKEVIEKTDISRATLNNYIKIGIIPAPVVMRPKDMMGRTKKIGYFPYEVLERIQEVKRLKKQGLSMAQIGARFQGSSSRVLPLNKKTETLTDLFDPGQSGEPAHPGEDALHLSLESLSFPAYLLTPDFDVKWANPEAMKKVFMQTSDSSDAIFSKNIFDILFHWGLHNVLQNWKDLLRIHISYVKSRMERNRFQKLCNGISAAEIEILLELYDSAVLFPEKDIHESHIHFIKNDNTTESYRVFTMSFREGRLFLYLSSKGFVPW
ncbi:MerR family transcriptional regulator [Thermodesulfobacteriota bacterium]